MLAAEHVAEALVRRPRQRRARELRRGLARRPTSAATCGRCATPSRCGRSSARSSASPRGGFDMWTQHARLLAVRHARPRQARLRRRSSPPRSASRSPIRSPTASSPSTGCRRCSCPTPITRRTSRRTCMVADMALQKASEHDVYAGPSARYCPAGVYEWVEEGGAAALRDQRAELRPLQNLRHQGPQPQHHLGAAGGRRRAEIFEYVMSGSARPATIPPHGDSHGGRIGGVAFRSLREERKKAILRPTRRAWRTAAHGGSHS